jgi:hypothetical protein
MARRCRTSGLVAGTLVVAGLVLAEVGFGAAPTIQRIELNETFTDELLSDECGVAVTSHIEGTIIERTFSGERTGVSQVSTNNVAVTAAAGVRTFRFRDVGASVTRIEPDGTAVLLITGQLPFEFAGVLKIDLETGETILEPRDRSEQELARACAVLTGG